MTNSANAAEAAAWNGQRGHDWVHRQGRLDALMTEVHSLLFDTAAPEPGEAVLDVGCGAGTTTLEGARRVGAVGRILAIDISAPLLDHATARAGAEGLDNIAFRLGDAQTHRFEARAFDLMISRFGVMFFDDPVAAFRNITGALRPGGRMVFVAWSSPAVNPWFAVPVQAATDVLGPIERPDPGAPGPMAFRDIDRVIDLLRKAGLTGCVGVEREVVITPAGTVDEVIDFLVSAGPAAGIIAARGGTDADRRAIAARCQAAMEPFLVEGRFRVPARVNLFKARRPT